MGQSPNILGSDQVAAAVAGTGGGAEADIVDWHQRWHPIGVTSARRLSHSTVVVPAKIAAAFATQVL